jgi:hypothetical protein
MSVRIYADKPIRLLIQDRFWWQGRMRHRNDDELPKLKPIYGRNERKTPTRAGETREAHS